MNSTEYTSQNHKFDPVFRIEADKKRFRWQKNQIGCYFRDGLPSNQSVEQKLRTELHFFCRRFFFPAKFKQ